MTMPLEPSVVKTVVPDWRGKLARILHTDAVGYVAWECLLEGTRENWRIRADKIIAELGLTQLLDERNGLAVDLTRALDRASRYARKIDEARHWARHGYEIGQRTCTWTDDGGAPKWLTEDHDPEALRGKEPVSPTAAIDLLRSQNASLQRLRANDKAYIRKLQDISEAAVNNNVALRVGITELLKIVEKFEIPRYIRDLDPELNALHDLEVGLCKLLDTEKPLDEAPSPDMGAVSAAERASMSRVTGYHANKHLDLPLEETVSGPDRETLDQEAVAVIGPKILSTSAMPQADTVLNWLGANFVRQVKRCWSCDHTAEFHQEDGCWYTIEHGLIGENLVCPCPIPRGQSAP